MGRSRPYAIVKKRSRFGRFRRWEIAGGRVESGLYPSRDREPARLRGRAAWALPLRPCTAGAGAVKLLEHSVAARSRPEQVLAAGRRATADTTVLEGDRGDDDDAASALLPGQPAS